MLAWIKQEVSNFTIVRAVEAAEGVAGPGCGAVLARPVLVGMGVGGGAASVRVLGRLRPNTCQPNQNKINQTTPFHKLI